MSAASSMGRRALERSAPASKSSAPRPSPRILPLGTSEVQRTVIGVGVPVAPSFLNLEDEETVAYDARDVPAVTLPALLARCAQKSAPASSETPPTAPVTPSEIRPREAAFHTVPNFPSDSSPEISVSAESNLHEVDGPRITNTLAATNEPIALVAKPVTATAKPVVAAAQPDEWIRLRIGPSTNPPPGIVAVSSERPRPTPRRSFFAKFLFTTIALAIALVASAELAAAGKLPRGLDPRPVLAKGVKVAQDKIPWDRMRHLAGH
jgi:hypothetical protein